MRIVDTGQMGQFLKQARNDLGLTQSDVAFATNLSVKHLSDLERGKATGSFADILKIIQSMNGHMDVSFSAVLAPETEDIST